MTAEQSAAIAQDLAGYPRRGLARQQSRYLRNRRRNPGVGRIAGMVNISQRPAQVPTAWSPDTGKAIC